MASVSGSLKVIVVPSCGEVARSIVPLSSSIFDLTMSMPIPRPDISVTFSTVVRPGSQTSWAIRCVLISRMSAADTSLFSTAFLAIPSISRPRPSSATRTIMLLPR